MTKRRISMIFVAVLALAMAVTAGCGDRSKDKKESSGEGFRIPDSLLASIEGYKLVRDDYHPVKGGVMANRDIELHYPSSNISRYIAVKNFGFVLSAYNLAKEKIGRPADGTIVVIGAKDLDEYQFLTRKEWWYYGEILGDTLYLEPLDVMLKRYDSATERTFAEIGTIQKISQMALRNISKDRIPLWMREGAASILADEGSVLHIQAFEFKDELLGFEPDVDELDNHLKLAMFKGETRISFFIAYTMVQNLLESSSFEDLVSFASRLGEGKSLDEASESVFGMNYSALVEKVSLKNDFTTYLGDLPEEYKVNRKEKHHH
ncbi:MAG: hypothetical protein JW746_01350 [Candidatus Krumholzibacteriota bacterium]|nr:hypothetical protein [Candidatus Krumholzibacteriota bacterium]